MPSRIYHGIEKTGMCIFFVIKIPCPLVMKKCASRHFYEVAMTHFFKWVISHGCVEFPEDMTLGSENQVFNLLWPWNSSSGWNGASRFSDKAFWWWTIHKSQVVNGGKVSGERTMLWGCKTNTTPTIMTSITIMIVMERLDTIDGIFNWRVFPVRLGSPGSTGVSSKDQCAWHDIYIVFPTRYPLDKTLETDPVIAPYFFRWIFPMISLLSIVIPQKGPRLCQRFRTMSRTSTSWRGAEFCGEIGSQHRTLGGWLRLKMGYPNNLHDFPIFSETLEFSLWGIHDF